MAITAGEALAGTRVGRTPLLFVAAGADRVAPPSPVRATARRYQRAGASAGYLELPGRCHVALGQEGRPEVTDRVLAWAEAAAAGVTAAG